MADDRDREPDALAARAARVRYQEDLTKVREQVEKLAKKKAAVQAQIDGDEARAEAVKPRSRVA